MPAPILSIPDQPPMRPTTLPHAELCRLIEADDLHALMIRVGDLWLARYYPASPFGTLSAYIEPGVPPATHTITHRSPSATI